MKSNVKKKKIRINWKEVGKSLNKHKRELLVGVIGIAIIVLLIIMISSFIGKTKYDEEAAPYDNGSTLKATEFNKILDHKKDIDNVLVEEHTEGKVSTRPYSIDDAYDMLANMKVIELTEERAKNKTIYYVFTMKDGTIYNVEFEGEFLRSEENNYVVVLPTKE